MAAETTAEIERRRKLIHRADQGDHQARAEIMALWHDSPELAQATGDPYADAEAMLVGLVSRNSWVKAEAARTFLAQKRRELAGPNPSALELAIAQQLALAFYELDHLNYLSVGVSRFMGNQAAKLIEDRRDRAHRRAMSAAKTLAMVRRLLSGKPALAVGVQVNVNKDPTGSA